MEEKGTPENNTKRPYKSSKTILQRGLERLTTSFTYKRADDEKKAKLISEAREDLLDRALFGRVPQACKTK